MTKNHVLTYNPHGQREIGRLQKLAPLKTYVHIHPSKGRYCEHCQQLKPTNGLAHNKGWECTDCILEKREKQND